MMWKIFLFVGIIFILVGLFMLLLENGHLKWMNWLGNLPGDIRIEKENFKLYIPLTSMLLLSIVISLLFRLLKKLF